MKQTIDESYIIYIINANTNQINQLNNQVKEL